MAAGPSMAGTHRQAPTKHCKGAATHGTKNLSKSHPATPQKPIPAPVVISESIKSLERADGHLTALDGLSGIFAEVDQATDYVRMSDLANGFRQPF